MVGIGALQSTVPAEQKSFLFQTAVLMVLATNIANVIQSVQLGHSAKRCTNCAAPRHRTVRARPLRYYRA